MPQRACAVNQTCGSVAHPPPHAQLPHAGAAIVLPEWFETTVPDVPLPSPDKAATMAPAEVVMAGNRAVGRVGWSFQRGSGPLSWCVLVSVTSATLCRCAYWAWLE